LRVTIDSILVRDQEVAATDFPEGTVVLSVRAGAYFGFNQVASEIWGMLAKPHHVGEIFDTLLQRHVVDADTLARDVTPFLQTLLKHHLVRMIDHGQAR
jgi:hypothetical protein